MVIDDSRSHWVCTKQGSSFQAALLHNQQNPEVPLSYVNCLMSWSFPPTSLGGSCLGDVSWCERLGWNHPENHPKEEAEIEPLISGIFARLQRNEWCFKRNAGPTGSRTSGQHSNPESEPLWPTMASSDQRIKSRSILCLYYVLAACDEMRLVWSPSVDPVGLRSLATDCDDEISVDSRLLRPPCSPFCPIVCIPSSLQVATCLGQLLSCGGVDTSVDTFLRTLSLLDILSGMYWRFAPDAFDEYGADGLFSGPSASH